MHKQELVDGVAALIDMPKHKIDDVVTAFVEEVTLALSRQDEVRLPGFGSFSTRHRPARSGRSPQTGEAITIAAANTVGFRPGKALKAALNGG